jgi:transposase
MSPYRRISIGYAVGDNTDNEWHQKIRDILDIHQPVTTEGVEKPQRPMRRRTVCCDSSTARVQKDQSGRDESTASLSYSSGTSKLTSSCDTTPTSHTRPGMATLFQSKLSPSPKQDNMGEQQGAVLAKHRINSPRRGSTGSPFAEVKSPTVSPNHKALTPSRVVDVRRMSDDLPEVPFSPPVSDHGYSDTSSYVSTDDYPSPVSIKNNSLFRRLSCGDVPATESFQKHLYNTNDAHGDSTSKAIHSRRSSCGDPPAHNFSKTSCKDRPKTPCQLRHQHYPQSEKINYDYVLESRYYCASKTTTPKYSIKVQRRSSYGDSNTLFDITPPFAANPSSIPRALKEGSRLSATRTNFDVDSPPDFLRQASQSLLSQQRQRTSDIPIVITLDKMTRRASNNDTCKGSERVKQRRRASNYDVPYTSCDAPSNDLKDARIKSHTKNSFRAIPKGGESRGNNCCPPISVLVCKKSAKKHDIEKMKLQDPPSSRTSPFAFF